MAFCQHCGSRVADGAKFCENCGATMDTTAAQPAQPAQPTYAQPTYAQPVYNQQQGYNTYTPNYYNQPVTPISTTGLMAWSIITLLLCTIPGIVAIVKTTQINKAVTVEQQDAAVKAAKTWCIVGTVLGILAVIGQLAAASM